MAATERKIKRRIRSARNVSQITRAMQMVAASKLRRAQERALAGKPYAEEILRLVRDARRRVKPQAHPLLALKGRGDKKLVILISTNKGLCGSLNTDLFRKCQEWLPKDQKAEFVTLGKKAQAFVARTGRSLQADFSDQDFLESVPALSKIAREGFLQGEYEAVFIAFSEFRSALAREPRMLQILPFSEQEEDRVDVQKKESELLVEPSYDAVLSTLLPHVIEIQIRRAILEAEASEHAARMLAMKNATDNALELIDNLTLVYNKVRQEAITNEIADMVTARMAVQ